LVLIIGALLLAVCLIFAAARWAAQHYAVTGLH